MTELTSSLIGQDFTIPEGIRKACAALRRDLPALLADRRARGKWACYCTTGLVGIGTDYAELIGKAIRRKIPTGEFIIERIEPGAGSEEEEEIVHNWI